MYKLIYANAENKKIRIENTAAISEYFGLVALESERQSNQQTGYGIKIHTSRPRIP
jgi:hypothetical protein